MADPVTFLALVSAGSSIVGGVQQKKAADKAAEAAQSAGEFNAQIIERDIDLFERQRGVLNAMFSIDQRRAREIFERDVQGTVRASTGYAGFDMSQGTPMTVLRENAREFDFQTAIGKFDNEVQNLQISDAQEESRLNAAASSRASGTASLISGFGRAASSAEKSGLFT